MSYYDDASLVVIPSGYKTSKVYAEKPTDGSGDLAFTRTGDTATRVNSAGLIEKVRTNLVPNGLSFNSATGVLYTTITSDSPISGVSSTRITKNEASGTLRYGNQNCSASVLTGSISYTISRYFKYDGHNLTTSLEYNSSLSWGGTGWAQNIDIASTGVTLQAPSNCTSKISNVGNGWYRVEVTILTGASPTGSPVTYLLKVASTLSTGQGFLTAAPQLEVSDFGATAYIPTTTAAVSVGPVANVPRLDYLGSTCPRLLLEPQRSNLALYSEQFNNAYWLKFRLDLGINTQISPSGIQNADTFTSSVGAVDIPVIATQTFTYVGNTRYSSSIFVKKIGNVNSFQISYVDNATGYTGGRVTYNVVTQAITITQSPNASVTATMENVGNGWYRLVLNFLTIAVPTYNYIAFEIPTTSITNTFAIWGAQLEAGSYATSYIPTLAASATRGADACLKTGISSLIGQTEGVLFVNAVLTHSTGATNEYLAQVNASANNRILIYRQNSTNKLGAILIVGGAVIYSVLTSGAITSTAKVAFAYKSGDFAFYVNGTQVGTSSATYTTPPSMGSFDLDSNGGTENGFYSYNQALLFKTRLTNAELATLTTL